MPQPVWGSFAAGLGGVACPHATTGMPRAMKTAAIVSDRIPSILLLPSRNHDPRPSTRPTVPLGSTMRAGSGVYCPRQPGIPPAVHHPLAVEDAPRGPSHEVALEAVGDVVDVLEARLRKRIDGHCTAPPERHITSNVSSGFAILRTRSTKSGSGRIGNCFLAASHSERLGSERHIPGHLGVPDEEVLLRRADVQDRRPCRAADCHFS